MREIQDASLKVTATLPNAGNTVNTNAIDLGSTTPYPVTEQIQVRLTTAEATGANNKNINITLQHSHEAAANFVAIPELATKVCAGNATKVAAVTHNVALPPGTRRYIRASAVGEENGGDSSGANFTVQVLV